jgi:hypothetical protein
MSSSIIIFLELANKPNFWNLSVILLPYPGMHWQSLAQSLMHTVLHRSFRFGMWWPNDGILNLQREIILNFLEIIESEELIVYWLLCMHITRGLANVSRESSV